MSLLRPAAGVESCKQDSTPERKVGGDKVLDIIILQL